MYQDIPYTEEEKQLLRHCELCPRKCGANRLEGEKGFCNCGVGLEIAMICNHKGEEPIICKERGICNVFFSHCNLQCVYCQNKQISDNKTCVKQAFDSFEQVIEKIIEVLKESENVLGFVSPTQHQMLMKAIIREIRKRGYNPITIYNTNAYDNPQMINQLEEYVNVYLPDYKYALNSLSSLLSRAEDYPQMAFENIKEMYRQKGNSILTDGDGNLESGLIVRHLVLPNQLDNTRQVLENITDISFNLTVSLMSQYAPNEEYPHSFLNRPLSQQEYDEACDMFQNLGLHKGYFQALTSQNNLVPDFDKGTWSKGEN